MDAPLAVIVLAAGSGTRMKSTLPKVLHPIAGMPMLWHVLRALETLQPARIVGVVAPDSPAVAAAFAPHATAVQDKPLGTAHAAMAGLKALGRFDGEVMIVFGDTPLVTPETLRRLRARRSGSAGSPSPALALLGFQAADPKPYGRLVVDGEEVVRIVESRDADEDERRITLCNSGVMAVDGALLPKLLARVGNANVKNEFYLTEIVALAKASNHRCVFAEGEETEFLGINTRAELAAAEAAMQTRLRTAAMESGVTLRDPASTWLAADTRLGQDVVVGPSVLFGPGVEVGDRVEIKGFCHIEGAVIGPDAIVGPFARLRPGTELAEQVHIGNFVEVKNATLGPGTKANHLAYLGDVDVGGRSNIGAGGIVVNYDGFAKWRSTVGDDAFIGSNSSLVSPIVVGNRVYVPAGSVITQSVPDDAVTFGRARQVDKPGRAPSLRKQLAARAAAEKSKPKPKR